VPLYSRDHTHIGRARRTSPRLTAPFEWWAKRSEANFASPRFASPHVCVNAPFTQSGIHTYEKPGKARRTSPALPRLSSQMVGEARRGDVGFVSPHLSYVCMVWWVGAARRRIKVIKTGQSLVEMNIDKNLLYSDWLSPANFTRAWRNTIVFLAASPRLCVYMVITLRTHCTICQAMPRGTASPCLVLLDQFRLSCTLLHSCPLRSIASPRFASPRVCVNALKKLRVDYHDRS